MDNSEMKRRVLTMFDSIVNEVDPKGHILDCLLQQDIVTHERRREIEIMKSRFERARSVLWHLLESQARHPSAYVDFVNALKRDYQHLADDIRTTPYDQLLPQPRFDNEAAKKVVEKQFLTKINSEIDPKYILDYMYTHGLVDMETLNDIRDPSLQHQRARVFTDHLRTYSDPHAYARFLEALELKYPHLAKNIIDAVAESTSGSGAQARDTVVASVDIPGQPRGALDVPNQPGVTARPVVDAPPLLAKDQIIIVTECTQDFYAQNKDSAYEMTRKPRGYAVIINLFHYPPGPKGDDRRRHGTETDGAKLEVLMEKLHFDVKHHHNIEVKDKDTLTNQEILNWIEFYAKQEEVKKHQCFVLFILAHGGKKQVGVDNLPVIYGSDDSWLDLRAIYAALEDKNCPNLKGKPRLLFIQACRGDHLPVADGTSLVIQQYKPPVLEDFLICFSTQDYYKSMRYESGDYAGGWFIHSLVETFMMKSCKETVLDMMTQVRKEVKKFQTSYNQVTSDNQNLMNKIYFFPGIIESMPGE